MGTEIDMSAGKTDQAKEKRVYFLWLAVVAALSLGLRLYRAGDAFGGFHSYNEAWYSILATNYTGLKSFLFPTSFFGTVDYNVSPFLSYLLYFAMKIAGRNEGVLRFVPILFSVMTLPLLYAFGARYIGRFAGLCAAAFYGFVPVSMVVGRNVQTDAAYVFFMLASLMVYLSAKDAGRRGKARMFVAGLLFGIAFMTKQFAVLLLPAVFIWEILERRGFRWFGIAHLSFGAGALIVPGPYFLYHLIHHADKLFGSQHALSVSQFEWPTFSVWHYLVSEYFWGYSPFLAVPAVIGVVYFLVKRNEGVSLAMLSALVFILFNMIWHGHSYYMLFAAPFLCMVAGGLFERFRPRAAAWAVAALLVALAAVHSVAFLCAAKYGYDEFLTLSKIIDRAGNPVVVSLEALSGSFLPVMKYYNPESEILTEGDLRDSGKKEVSFGPERGILFVGFAGEDDKVMPWHRFHILRKSYVLYIAGYVVAVGLESEHFFKVNGVIVKKMGGPWKYGVDIIGKEKSLVLGASPPGTRIPLPDGWIDFRVAEHMN